MLDDDGKENKTFCLSYFYIVQKMLFRRWPKLFLKKIFKPICELEPAKKQILFGKHLGIQKHSNDTHMYLLALVPTYKEAKYNQIFGFLP